MCTVEWWYRRCEWMIIQWSKMWDPNHSFQVKRSIGDYLQYPFTSIVSSILNPILIEYYFHCLLADEQADYQKKLSSVGVKDASCISGRDDWHYVSEYFRSINLPNLCSFCCFCPAQLHNFHCGTIFCFMMTFVVWPHHTRSDIWWWMSVDWSWTIRGILLIYRRAQTNPPWNREGTFMVGEEVSSVTEVQCKEEECGWTHSNVIIMNRKWCVAAFIICRKPDNIWMEYIRKTQEILNLDLTHLSPNKYK
jgi:hypothetical protein